jgi:hypothetical protein
MRKQPWWVHLLVFVAVFAVVAGGGTLLLLHAWPTITYSAFHREIASGFGSGRSVPDNTLYTIPSLASPDVPNADSLIKSGNQDGLYTVGWIDLSKGSRAISIPHHGDRYLNVSLIDPATGVIIGNLTDPGTTTISQGRCPVAAACLGSSIVAPDQQVLVIGRTFVANESDVAAGLADARRITLKATGR